MLKTDARVGMKVVFGRPGEKAEKSLGKIVKINPTKAKVELLEERGKFKTRPIGTVFLVPYELMEQESNQETNNQKTTNQETNNQELKVKPGTTFFHHYADSDPRWRVVSSKGNHCWLCVVDNPIKLPNGETITGDWDGTQKVFMTREILDSIINDRKIQEINQENESFYESLQPDQIVHYHNGFGNWVRCVVTRKNNQNVLTPIALLGNWEKHELPKRQLDGSIHLGHHAKQIQDKETFSPHYSNIWESKHHLHAIYPDPSKLTPINLDLPEMTEEEKANSKLWGKIEEIQQILSKVYIKDPKETLNKIAEIIKTI